MRGRASAMSGGLSEEEVARYWAEGFVAVRGVFSRSEVLVWRRECDRLWAAASINDRDSRIQWREHATKGEVPDRFDPVIDISPVFHRLAQDDRLLDAARSVLGSEATLLKDKLITKRPGTKGYGMHQDFTYWAFLGVPADAIVTVQVSIDAAGEANAAIEVFPRLHRRQLEAPPEEPRDVDETKMDLSDGRVVRSRPGDILLFHSLVPHRSAPNTSLQNRRAIFVTYVTGGNDDVYERYHAENHHGARPVPRRSSWPSSPSPSPHSRAARKPM
ncbi:MAG: phytanoyl-CoA dioxygenase family protein [Thermoanaerobaculia bacterium]